MPALKRRLRSAVFAATVGVGVIGGLAAPASAGWFGDYLSSGVRIRTQPSATSTIVGLGYPGQRICADYGVNGWIHHRNYATGKVGFSANNLVGYYPGVGC